MKLKAKTSEGKLIYIYAPDFLSEWRYTTDHVFNLNDLVNILKSNNLIIRTHLNKVTARYWYTVNNHDFNSFRYLQKEDALIDGIRRAFDELERSEHQTDSTLTKKEDQREIKLLRHKAGYYHNCPYKKNKCKCIRHVEIN